MMATCHGEYITDKFRGRWLAVVGVINALGIAFALASIGYVAVGLVTDPLGPVMYVAAILVGIGEVSAILGAGVLIGQVAPEGHKGTVFGTGGFAGSLGIITLTFAGGQVFDAYGAEAPFLMMGAVNALVVGVIVLFTFMGSRSTVPR